MWSSSQRKREDVPPRAPPCSPSSLPGEVPGWIPTRYMIHGTNTFFSHHASHFIQLIIRSIPGYLHSCQLSNLTWVINQWSLIHVHNLLWKDGRRKFYTSSQSVIPLFIYLISFFNVMVNGRRCWTWCVGCNMELYSTDERKELQLVFSQLRMYFSAISYVECLLCTPFSK